MSAQRMNGDKPSYPIYLWNGILEEAHVECIGPAIWLFLWAIDRTTEERPSKDGSGYEGWVYGGMPVTLERIAKEVHSSRRSVSRNLERLMQGEYLRLTLAPHGYVIRVQNSCKWPNKQSGESKMAYDDDSTHERAKMAHVVSQKRPSGEPKMAPPVPKMAHVIRQNNSYGVSSEKSGEKTPHLRASSLSPLEENPEIQPQPQNQEKPLPVGEGQTEDPETIRIWKERMARQTPPEPRKIRLFTPEEIAEQKRALQERFPEQFAKEGVAR
jgi:hypothetical protein